MTDLISTIIRDVAELPDRNSPEDFPAAMLVTADELKAILDRHISCRVTALVKIGQAAIAVGWKDGELEDFVRDRLLVSRELLEALTKSLAVLDHVLLDVMLADGMPGKGLVDALFMARVAIAKVSPSSPCAPAEPAAQAGVQGEAVAEVTHGHWGQGVRWINVMPIPGGTKLYTHPAPACGLSEEQASHLLGALKQYRSGDFSCEGGGVLVFLAKDVRECVARLTHPDATKATPDER